MKEEAKWPYNMPIPHNAISKACAVCGDLFLVPQRSASQTTCSRVCSGEARHTRWDSPERMLAYILERIIPLPWSGCWIWDKCIDAKGYGVIGSKGRQIKATHLALMTKGTTVPSGMAACHICDIPSCVNPEHLFVGTHLDNARDSVKKDRRAKGQNNGFATLTINNVLAIRDDPRSASVLAKCYNVGATTIWLVKNRKTWRHV